MVLDKNSIICISYDFISTQIFHICVFFLEKTHLFISKAPKVLKNTSIFLLDFISGIRKWYDVFLRPSFCASNFDVFLQKKQIRV